MVRLKIMLSVSLLSAFALACGQAANRPTANTNINVNAAAPAPAAGAPAPATPDEASLAKELYAKNCAVCHKESGKGGKVTIEDKTIDPDDITTAKMKAKTDEQLYKYVADGFPDDGMPAFKEKLSPDQIKTIVRYVRVLQGS